MSGFRALKRLGRCGSALHMMCLPLRGRKGESTDADDILDLPWCGLTRIFVVDLEFLMVWLPREE